MSASGQQRLLCQYYMGATAALTRLAVIIHAVTLEDQMNPVLITVIPDRMVALVVYFYNFTDTQVLLLFANAKHCFLVGDQGHVDLVNKVTGRTV